MADKKVIMGEREVTLRYGARAIDSIEKLAGQKIGEAGLRFMSARSGIQFGPKDAVPIDLAMQWIDFSTSYMLWIFGKGLEHKESGVELDKTGVVPQSSVQELYDEFMNVEEADNGNRYQAFKDLAVDGINLSRGIDTKKLKALNKEEAEKKEMERLTKIETSRLSALKEMEERQKSGSAINGMEPNPSL